MRPWSSGSQRSRRLCRACSRRCSTRWQTSARKTSTPWRFRGSPIHARIDGADGDIAQLSLDADALNVRLTSAEGNVAALEQTVSDQGARIALVADADGVNAASIVAAINNGGSSVTLSADKIDLNGITTVADTLHIGSENSLERKYLIFHKSGAVISATRGDVPELKLSAGKIDLCGTLYHNGQPLDL